MTRETGKVPGVEEVADRLAIMDVLAKHSRGVDRADEATLKSAYWPEAEVEYGGFNGRAHEFCEMLPGAIKRYARTQHSITNTAIEFSGDAGDAYLKQAADTGWAAFIAANPETGPKLKELLTR